jgi:pyrroloquinoline quinone (PQQ) biosynthesis protein C
MKDIIRAVLAEHPIDANPYMRSLRDGSMNKDDFLETQIQFYFAVVFFSRPMAVLAAKIPSSKLRLQILRNVWEEHGEGVEDRRHGATFLMLLDRLAKLSVDDVESRKLWPELRAFNTILIGCTSLDDWEIGGGCLGMIERMFAEISAWIGGAIVERGWLAEDRVVHYALHAELDIKHSDDFFETLRPTWEQDDRSRYLIEQGLRLGGYVFDRLYRDLFEARSRRWVTPIRRPQDRVYAE